MEKKTSDDELLDYLDGLMDEQHSQKLEIKIVQSPEMKSRLEELRVIHHTLKSQARLETPSVNFTQRVMKQLEFAHSANGISPKNGLFLLGGIVAAVGVALVLLQAGAFDALNGNISLEKLPIRKEWNYSLPSVPFNGKLVVNIILIVATGLAFVLLDRTILRPMFDRRSRVV